MVPDQVSQVYNKLQYDNLAESMKQKVITLYRAHSDTFDSQPSSKTKYPNHIAYLRFLAKRLLVHEWKMNIS